MMKKIPLALAGMLLLSIPALSAKKMTDSQILEMGRHKVAVSWGLEPTGPSNYDFGDFTGARGDKVRDETSNSGAIAASYGYRILTFLEVGVAYSFTATKGHSNTLVTSDYTYRTQSHAILPMVTFHWLNRSWGGLYSRVGLGVRFESVKKTEDDTSQTERDAYASIQISAVGIEIGRKLAGFGELGIGILGVVRVGARYRF